MEQEPTITVLETYRNYRLIKKEYPPAYTIKKYVIQKRSPYLWTDVILNEKAFYLNEYQAKNQWNTLSHFLDDSYCV